MQKVITNLVLNARDAVSAGGEIRVETSRRDGWVVLAVADNGCGMTPDFIQRSLFRPFQTTKRKGIGIGMFHCKMIVEAHKGRIEVESAPGKGTAFRVFLPCPRINPNTPDPTPMLPKPRLLIVDDDEEIRTQMKWALNKDYELLLAEDRDRGD